MTRTKVLEIKDGIWDNVKKWVRDSGVLQRESMCGTEGTDTSDQIQLSHGLGQVPLVFVLCPSILSLVPDKLEF